MDASAPACTLPSLVPPRRVSVPDDIAAGADARVDLLTDDDLVRQARAGDRLALEQIAERYRGRLCVFARAMLPRSEDAEDAAQETLALAFGHLERYEPRGHFRTWIMTIAANVCRGHLRRERRRGDVLVAEVESDEEAPGAGSVYARSEMRRAVREAIAELRETYRAPVVLHYLEDMPIAEVAAVLGRTQTAVKVQLWRARGQLARKLESWVE
jgi:RNA polymerase sigma-70 factor, ECF subfamily